MKTKYVKVPVSERLPEKEGFYDCEISGISGFIKIRFYSLEFKFAFDNDIIAWLEEAPDHSEEMLSLLEDIVDAQYNPDTTLSEMNIRVRKAKEFLNKVKDNGK